MGNCVTVARLALNQLVQVRILVPQLHFHPSKRLDSRRRPFGRRGFENGLVRPRCYRRSDSATLLPGMVGGRTRGQGDVRAIEGPGGRPEPRSAAGDRPAGWGLTHRGWWLTIRLARHDGLRALALADATGQPFRFSVPEVALEALHAIALHGRQCGRGRKSRSVGAGPQPGKP